MPKYDFNKVTKQIYWNYTSVWVFSCKFAAYFRMLLNLNYVDVLIPLLYRYSTNLTDMTDFADRISISLISLFVLFLLTLKMSCYGAFMKMIDHAVSMILHHK